MSFDEYDTFLIGECKAKCVNVMQTFYQFYDDLVKFYDPDKVLKFSVDQVKMRTFLSGGCTASLLTGNHPHNYDIYLTDETLAENFKEYFQTDSGKFFLNSNGDNYPQENDRQPLKADEAQSHPAITKNAITLNTQIGLLDYYAPAQIIISKLDGIEATIGSFDYEHCKPYYVYHDNAFMITWKQFALIQSWSLLVANPYANTSVERLQKFIDRGWKLKKKGDKIEFSYSVKVLNQIRPPREMIL